VRRTFVLNNGFRERRSFLHSNGSRAVPRAAFQSGVWPLISVSDCPRSNKSECLSHLIVCTLRFPSRRIRSDTPFSRSCSPEVSKYRDSSSSTRFAKLFPRGIKVQGFKFFHALGFAQVFAKEPGNAPASRSLIGLQFEFELEFV
jgi:hypothetical protein